ncbi:MAG: RNA pseudouridine synthase [Kangiellaceae bacterium]|nr:RNA pseudouridine synthase [Kangiellaceae bacterium]|tara:strand:- start:26280 stop:26912 length:633 start_codon:yes stop_codon:yes gene_type:complete
MSQIEGIPLLYQDDDIVVVNKPHYVLSVPGRTADKFDSVATRLQKHWPYLRVVHRLDWATSGVMVFAFHHASQKVLNEQFAKRTTSKGYQALVYGKPTASQGVVDMPLICDWDKRPKQKVCWHSGKSAQTLWWQLGVENQGAYTRLELAPFTGRSHQLRVHLQQLGHPIVGDKLYAKEPTEPRMMLHAHTLGVVHPITQQLMSFHAPVPF